MLKFPEGLVQIPKFSPQGSIPHLIHPLLEVAHRIPEEKTQPNRPRSMDVAKEISFSISEFCESFFLDLKWNMIWNIYA